MTGENPPPPAGRAQGRRQPSSTRRVLGDEVSAAAQRSLRPAQAGSGTLGSPASAIASSRSS